MAYRWESSLLHRGIAKICYYRSPRLLNKLDLGRTNGPTFDLLILIHPYGPRTDLIENENTAIGLANLLELNQLLTGQKDSIAGRSVILDRDMYEFGTRQRYR